MIDRTVLRKAIANQYQAILALGAVAFSVLIGNPLPIIGLLGAELMVLPLVMERLHRRMEIERKHASRQVKAISQDQQYQELSPAARGRFLRLKQLCEQIQENHGSLSEASQAVIAEQVEKFDAILVSCLRRLWLVKKHDEIAARVDGEDVAGEIERLRGELDAKDLAPRVRGALAQNLEIKERLLETVSRNAASRAALEAELDSLESLLQLLLQKSLSGTDSEAFAMAIDDVLAQAEADAQSVAEMEQLVGAMPEIEQRTRLSDTLRRIPPVSDARPPPPPRQRVPEGPRHGQGPGRGRA